MGYRGREKIKEYLSKRECVVSLEEYCGVKIPPNSATSTAFTAAVTVAIKGMSMAVTVMVAARLMAMFVFYMVPYLSVGVPVSVSVYLVS